MEVKNFNQYTIINENDQKYMKNRKTLIIERMNVIKKLENLYKFDYNKPSKKITIETNKNEEIQSSKNLFNPLIKNKNIFLNNSQRKLFSKKDLINPILIDNINSNNIKFDKTNLLNNENTNQKNNEIKNTNLTNIENISKSYLENQNITNSNYENTNNLTNFESINLNITNLNNNISSNLSNKIKNQLERKSMSLFSSPMTLSINRRTTQRNSEVYNTKLSYKLLDSPKKNLKVPKKFYSNLNPKNYKKYINDNNNQINKYNLTERKVSNAFEISEDDLIFEEMNKFNEDGKKKKNKLNNKKKSHSKSKSNLNEKSKMNQTKTTISSHKSSLSQDNKILSYIYKYPIDYFQRIYEAKKAKKKLNLLNYQNNLLNIINKNCSKDAYINLETNFQKIRSFSYQKVILNRKFIEKMEKKEKKIVKKINFANKKCEKMLKTADNFFNFKTFSLPKVIFYKVIKKKNAHFFQQDSDESENN
jgi:hypothetical protein